MVHTMYYSCQLDVYNCQHNEVALHCQNIADTGCVFGVWRSVYCIQQWYCVQLATWHHCWFISGDGTEHVAQR